MRTSRVKSRPSPRSGTTVPATEPGGDVEPCELGGAVLGRRRPNVLARLGRERLWTMLRWVPPEPPLSPVAPDWCVAIVAVLAEPASAVDMRDRCSEERMRATMPPGPSSSPSPFCA